MAEIQALTAKIEAVKAKASETLQVEVIGATPLAESMYDGAETNHLVYSHSIQ